MNPETSHGFRPQALAIMAALSKEVRLNILDYLLRNQGDALQASCVAESLGLSKSNLSFHIMQLLDAGLVAQRKEGQCHYYTVRTDTLSAFAAYITSLSGGTAPAILPAPVAKHPAMDMTAPIVAQAERLAGQSLALVQNLQESLVDEVMRFMQSQAGRALPGGGEKALRARLHACLDMIHAPIAETAVVGRAIASNDRAACLRLIEEIESRRDKSKKEPTAP